MEIPDGFIPMKGMGPFADVNGPLYVRPADATLGFKVGRGHCNPIDVCHGGWLGTFLDMQMPMIALRESGIRDCFLVTITLSLDYLAPVRVGAWVEGSASVLRRTGSLVFIQGVASSSGELLLRASGVYKVVSRPSEPRTIQSAGAISS
jgi:acyl-coenzyme A thioesterase PaaI-like protein